MMSARMVLTYVLPMLPALILMVDITVHVTQDTRETDSIAQVRLVYVYFYILIMHSAYSPLDINECDIVPSVCHNDADCTDSDGSYECTCREGYSGNGTICEGIFLV